MRDLLRLIVVRVAAFVPMLLASSFLVFLLIDLAPGDPAAARYGLPVSRSLRESLLARYGLDKPLPERYWDFVKDAVHGDFGYAVVSGRPVGQLISDALPITLQLSALALLIAVTASVVCGVVSAVTRDRWPDHVLRVLSVGFLAAPSFWLALLAISLFAVSLGWLPSGGYVPFGDNPGRWLRSMVLPSVTLSLPVTGVLTRVVRAAVIDELDRDYVRAAFGQGLSPLIVIGRGVLRNALIPPLTVLGLYIGTLLAGAVLIETVFELPGMGSLIVNGALHSDLAVVRAIALVTVGLFLISNLVVDAAYILLNPRLRSTT